MSNYGLDQTKKPLSKRSPEEWLKRIKELPSEIQPVISKLVWWQYFGDRTRANAWPHLDDIRCKPSGNIPEDDQIKALIKLGYTRHHASKKVGCNY